MKRRLLLTLAALPLLAHADALDQLAAFQREVKSGRLAFTQTVSSPSGRKKTSKGQFEFLRPNRFRFDYEPPEAQILIGDGKKVWLIDPDLNQASSRPLEAVLGSTPIALLAGSSLGDAFKLSNDASEGDISWVLAVPKQADQGIQRLRIGLRRNQLAAMELVDGLGQRSRLDFSRFEANVAIDPERLKFVPAKGMDVIDG
ncbi:MAG: outer membrane lipoprotein chaperone LolA [Burkholderiales bacterium]|uniref:outer membrane lipoprotein chaperone LolA n=1 Tax=Inhella sp. TaxID=1921806 RepID=UPI001ACC7777|nr:outer membrane lipoprotein chaperone LolA [Burkholderiales bacterium]